METELSSCRAAARSRAAELADAAEAAARRAAAAEEAAAEARRQLEGRRAELEALVAGRERGTAEVQVGGRGEDVSVLPLWALGWGVWERPFSRPLPCHEDER